jgi:hypothetical protein
MAYSTDLKQKMKNKIPSQEIKIEGVGTGKLFGELNTEKLIKRLLQSDSITG